MGVRSRPFPRSNAFGVFALLVSACATVGGQPRYANKLAPYVPSPQPIVERMLELASVKPGETVYDLGCGDGRVLITAAKRFNAKAVGIEISDKLVQQTEARVQRLGLEKQVTVIHGDLRQTDLSGADVVVMYLLTLSNAEIRPKLEKSLKPGARVVSYSYAVPGWKPTRVDKTDERHGHLIYLYEMPPEPAR